MANKVSSALPLSFDEKERLTVLLEAVSSRTLLKVLWDMEGGNADARLIVEVLLDRMTPSEREDGYQGPVMPR